MDGATSVTIRNNILTDNGSTGNTAGIFVYDCGTVKLINNVIAENDNRDADLATIIPCGGARIHNPTTLTMTNNTIADNHADGDGGGVCLYLHENEDKAYIYNNIVWNNTADGCQAFPINNDGNADYTYSPVYLQNNDFDKSETGFCISKPNFKIPPSNLDNIDPLFLYPEERNYRLTGLSPLLDKGKNNAWALPAKDRDGNPRIVNSLVDMGDYEYDAELPTVTLETTDKSAAESGGNGKFVIRRTGDTTAALKVSYLVTGTAGNGEDYQKLSGTMTIAAGAKSKALWVTPLDDTLVEGDETVVVTVRGGVGYTVGIGSVGEVLIADNEGEEERNRR